MASALFGERKHLITELERSNIEDAVGPSWAALKAGDDPMDRGTVTLVVEVEATGRGWRGERGL